MAGMSDLHPEASTLRRSEAARRFIQRSFAVAYSYLSQLEGRSVKQYAEDIDFPYIFRFFKNEETYLIEDDTPLEKFQVRLLHKLLKTCCGLKPHNDEAWKTENGDILEFLITYCWSAHENLCEAPEMTDSELKHHMECVLKALLVILSKVEEKMGVNLNSLKYEMAKLIDNNLHMYNENLVCNYRYAIVSQHTVHKMLIILYQELNNLNVQSLSEFLTSRNINLVPHTLYSKENEFLEKNPRPQSMSINILYNVIRRVCFGFSPGRRESRESMHTNSVTESLMEKLLQEYNTAPYNGDECLEKSYKLYVHLKTLLIDVHKLKEGKSIKKIIQDLPREPYVIDSFRKPFELPAYSMEPTSTSPTLNLPTPNDPSGGSVDSLVHETVSPSQPVVASSSTDSSQSYIPEEKLNIAALYAAFCPGGVVVQTLALVFKSLGVGVPNGSNGQFSTPGDLTDLTYLEKRDVTRLCKWIRKWCPCLARNENLWSIPGDTLEYHIYFIKKLRNKMCHWMTGIASVDLYKTLMMIKKYLLGILEKTEQKLQSDRQDMKNKLQAHKALVDSKMNRFATGMPITSYESIMASMNDDKTFKIIKEGGSELLEKNLLGENLLHMLPRLTSDDEEELLTTKNIYVDRMLEDTLDGTLYQTKDVLFCEDNVFASSKVVVISGRSGGGKTSVCSHMYDLWSENLAESSSKGVDLLIYISCRLVTTKSIAEYLEERLHKTFSNMAVPVLRDDIIPLMQEPSIVFMIDGFDEAGVMAKLLIDDIFTSLPDSRMIITTKTQWSSNLTNKVKSMTSHYKVLRLREMTDDMQQKFTKNIFNASGMDTSDCDRFSAYLSQVRTGTDVLINSPLTVYLLSWLWSKDPEVAERRQTLAHLDHKLTDLILEYVSKRLQKDKMKCYSWMITLGKLAWKHFKNNGHQLNNQDMHILKNKSLTLELRLEENNHLLSSLLQCEEDKDSLDDDAKVWSFTSKRQQVYFASEYLVDFLVTGSSSVSETLGLPGEKDERFKSKLQMLLPIIELVFVLLEERDKLTAERVQELTEIMAVTESWAFTVATQLFKRILGKPGMESIIKTMFTNHEMMTFDNYDPQSILWVLKHTSLSVHNQVTLINTVHELPNVIPVMEFLKSISCSVKVIVDVDKPSNTSEITDFMDDVRLQDVTVTLMPWKPLCIAKLVEDWPHSRPLHLHLCPEVYHLVWWEVLMALLSLHHHRVTRIVYGSDSEHGEVLKEGVQWLGAQTSTDSSLAPSEILIQWT